MKKENFGPKNKQIYLLAAVIFAILLFGVAITAALVPVVSDVVKDPTEVPPQIFPRRAPTTVTVYLETKEVVAELSPGKKFYFWTFNGTVPGPMIRVMEGDTVIINLRNNETSLHPHNIDLHAVMGPGGGASVTTVGPGNTKTLKFKAMRAGAYIYHCAAQSKPWEHVSHGQYGLIMVEPKGGLPPVDKEFYMAQGEWYLTDSERSDPDNFTEPFYDLDEEKAMAEHPDSFTFNGHTEALSKKKNMTMNQGETARIFFGAGSHIGSNFHVIGQVFDKVYTGHPDTYIKNEETVYVAPGSAAVFEFEALVPGKYLLVDHSLWRAKKGALGFLQVNQTTPLWPFNIYDSIPRIFG